MGPFHILLDEMGLHQMGLDKVGIHPVSCQFVKGIGQATVAHRFPDTFWQADKHLFLIWTPLPLSTVLLSHLGIPVSETLFKSPLQHHYSSSPFTVFTLQNYHTYADRHFHVYSANLVYVIENTCWTIWLNLQNTWRSLRYAGYIYQTVLPRVILEAICVPDEVWGWN